jgi:hypothetical protein
MDTIVYIYTLEVVMDEAQANILKLQQQLSILGSKQGSSPAPVRAVNSISSYLDRTREAILQANQLSQQLEQDAYYSYFNAITFEILSSSPFTTKTHLCAAFNCSELTIDEWAKDHPTFAKAIEQGLIAGEILARELLAQAAFDAPNSVNTTLLKTLATNVYDIKDEHNISLKAPDTVSFLIEVVKANASKDTNT